MQIFVTGASGHIGRPVVAELIDNGHTVVGLARSDASADTIAAAGADVVRGDITDLDLLRRTADAADGVVHLAFRHDLMAAGRHGDAVDDDLRAVQAIADALSGTDKPFVNTTGTLMLAGLGRAGTELDTLESGPRIDSENATIALAERGVRSSVVRLSPTVHSSLDKHGFVPTLIAAARRHGVSPYVGDGATRWSAVHTLDAARLYRLAVERAQPGTRLHGVGEEGIAFRDIAGSIGRHLDVPVRSIAADDADEAEAHFGFLARFVQLDAPASNALTREWLGLEADPPGPARRSGRGPLLRAGLTAPAVSGALSRSVARYHAPPRRIPRH